MVAHLELKAGSHPVRQDQEGSYRQMEGMVACFLRKVHQGDPLVLRYWEGTAA